MELNYIKEWDIEDLLIKLNLASQMYWFCEDERERNRIYEKVIHIKLELRRRGWEINIPPSTERIKA